MVKDMISIKEHFNRFKNTNSAKYCSYPNFSRSCSNKIAKAHTIQKIGSLNKIAVNQHVLHFIVDIGKFKQDNLLPEVKSTGIRKASAFTGFCAYHDNILFMDIEKGIFQLNERSAFLLAYRATCRELYTKKAQNEMALYQLGVIKDRHSHSQAGLNYYQISVFAGLKDLELSKGDYDKILLSEDYSMVKYYFIRINKVPEFMCSGRTNPQTEFTRGKFIQNFMDLNKRLDSLAFSIISYANEGLISFSWIQDKENNACLDFIKSLHELSDDQISHAITRFTFSFFENVFFSPKWWYNLSYKNQRRLIYRINQICNMEENNIEWEEKCLLDDNYRMVNWEVVERKHNLAI